MRIFFILLLSLTFQEGEAQSKEIKEIRRLFAETQEKKGAFTFKQYDDFENSSEGGEIVVYRDHDEIRLIEMTYYGHLGKAEIQHYYSNGKLYFVFRVDHNYNLPPADKAYDQSKTVLQESRAYFWDDKMIRYLGEGNKALDTNSEEFGRLELEIINWALEVEERFK